MTEDQQVEQKALWWKLAVIALVAGLVAGLLYKVIGIVAGNSTEPVTLGSTAWFFPMLFLSAFYQKEHPGIIGIAYTVFTSLSAAFLSMGIYTISGQLCDGLAPGDVLRIVIQGIPLALGAVLFLKAPHRTHPVVVGAVVMACTLSIGLAAGVCLGRLF